MDGIFWVLVIYLIFGIVMMVIEKYKNKKNGR